MGQNSVTVRPVIRRLAIADIVVIGLAALISVADSVPFLAWLLNPHSALGVVSISALLLIATLVIVFLLFHIPPACKLLVADATERSFVQVSILLSSAAVFVLPSLWLSNAIGHR